MVLVARGRSVTIAGELVMFRDWGMWTRAKILIALSRFGAYKFCVVVLWRSVMKKVFGKNMTVGQLRVALNAHLEGARLTVPLWGEDNIDQWNIRDLDSGNRVYSFDTFWRLVNFVQREYP